MTAKNQNFEMFAGDTKNIDVTVAGVNLAGSTVKWAMKKTIYSAAPDVAKDTVDGITVTDPNGGRFTISLLPSETRSLSGTYYHEAEITDANGNVSTIFTGTITINRSGV